MNPRRISRPLGGGSLDIDAIRLSNLRIMHSKVDELHHIITNLKRRHNAVSIHEYADQPGLAEDTARVDETLPVVPVPERTR